MSDSNLDESAAIRGELLFIAGNAVGLSHDRRNIGGLNIGESQLMQDSVDRLRLNATKCRDLASTSVTSAAREVLDDLAQRYEHKAATLERSHAAHPRRRPAFKWSLE